MIAGVSARLHDLRHFLRGRRILFDYSRHYRRARAAYRALHDRAETVCDIGQIGVRVISPAAPGSFILPPDYQTLVSRVAEQAEVLLGQTDKCAFFPPADGGALPARTHDVREVRDGKVMAIQLLDPLSVPGIAQLSEPLVREFERRIYGSFVIVDKVYVYRSPVCRAAPAKSWLWHFDNHPREMLKVMVYLTDVDAGTAPFEYLEDASGRAVYGAPLAPAFGNSRVAESTVREHLDRGCACRRVTGPRGTIILFDDNVIHRATLAAAAHRDVLVLQVRPAAFAADPHIDPRWTGSFRHRAFNRDPADLAPHPNDGARA